MDKRLAREVSFWQDRPALVETLVRTRDLTDDIKESLNEQLAAYGRGRI